MTGALRFKLLDGRANAAIAFGRPEEGAHKVFIDLLHAKERRALTLRFQIAEGALESLSLGAQTVFVATGEFCR